MLDAGRLEDAQQFAEEGMALARSVQDVTHSAIAEGTLGQLAFVRGDMATARTLLEGLPQRLLRQGTLCASYAPWQELIEANIALGELDTAEELLGSFEGIAVRSNRWARAGAARARGLLHLSRDDDASATQAFDRALSEEGGMFALERGRILIAIGLAHRHERRRRAARETLEDAIVLLDDIGAIAWRDKARAELGRLSGRRSHGDELTDAEQRVAELAAQGRQNKEIASALFLGVSTVEKHLSNVYRKLGVRSRTELAGHFGDGRVGASKE
jgi:DNA-binding CsgD family transcriptional regulator